MYRLWLSFIVILLLEKNNSLGAKLGVQNIDGFGYELIQSQLECLENRFSERFDQLKQLVEVAQQQINENVERKITQQEKEIEISIGNKVSLISDQISNVQNSFSDLFEQQKKQEKRVEIDQQQLNVNLEQKITQLEKGIETSIGNIVSLLSDEISNLSNSFSERYDRLEKQLEQFNENVDRKATQLEKGIKVSLGNKVSQMTDQILKLQYRLLDEVDCSELPKSTSGLCSMVIGGNKTVVYQVHRFDVDWLTVLQRSDGSEDFHRNWTDYRDGFGTAGKEFWLGLERLHVLTKNDSYELAFELEDFDENYKYARYDKFSIAPEEDLYRLNVLGTYSGTAGDSFTLHKGKQFSTSDIGPARYCVNLYTGGWWYYDCYKSHPTGKWQRANKWDSIVWMHFGPEKNTPLKFARMLIRKMLTENVV